MNCPIHCTREDAGMFVPVSVPNIEAVKMARWVDWSFYPNRDDSFPSHCNPITYSLHRVAIFAGMRVLSRYRICQEDGAMTRARPILITLLCCLVLWVSVGGSRKRMRLAKEQPLKVSTSDAKAGWRCAVDAGLYRQDRG